MTDNNLKLSIDTTDNKKLKLGLLYAGKKYSVEKEIKTWASQMLLPEIKRLLDEHGFKVQDITQIEVNKGPGSFTGTRVGVAVANTLAFGLGIKVNGKKIELPLYEKVNWKFGK